MRLVIAGGGTGGHLFPALAVARAVKREDPDGSILFVGTENGIEARIMPETEFPVRFITARGMRGTGILNMARGALELPRGIMQSISILRGFKPDVVMGVGGYASGPTLVAAWLLRVPTAIQEQNSVMGTTNRLLSPFVSRIFLSWSDTTPPPPPDKTVLVGNPVREEILHAPDVGKDDDRFHLLIFGGSQGARSINRSLADNMDTLRQAADRLTVIHQTGREAVAEMERLYREAGIQAEVKEFIDDMAWAYRWADLVVCRAGASSLAELTALGKPAVVIPYPFAIGDHQARNAAALESRGAVRVVKEEQLKNGAVVAAVRSLADDPGELQRMAQRSRALGRPEAARRIALELLDLAGESAERNNP